MKKILLTLALGLLAALGLHAQELPALNLKNAKGAPVSTASLLDGKTPVAITFWASWCMPCQEELEALTVVAPDWEGDFPLTIYAVCVDDSRSISKARTLAWSADWPVTVLYDTNRDLARALNVSTIPHVFVFDAKGVCRYNHVGYAPGDEEILLEKVLQAK